MENASMKVTWLSRAIRLMEIDVGIPIALWIQGHLQENDENVGSFIHLHLVFLKTPTA